MSRSILSRTVLAAMLAFALLPVGRAQSQDSDSVAEAARRAREQKKAKANKPAKVITDDTFEVKKEDVQSATAEVPKVPGVPSANAQTTGANAAPAPNANAGNASGAAKDERLKKELADLQERLKNALTDLDLLRRENRLDQDTFYSKPDYGSDAAGKQKLEDEKQRIADKQQEVENMKAKIADLEKSLGSSSSSQP